MTLGPPIYPVQVASIATVWTGAYSYAETTPGSGYVNALGHSPDQSAGDVTLADLSYSSWTAPAQTWANAVDATAEDFGATVARFPARSDASSWLGYYIEVGYEGIAPVFYSGTLQREVTNREGVGRGDWSNRLTGVFFSPPYAPDSSSAYLPDASDWTVFRSVWVRIFPTGRDTASWAAGTFAVRFSQVTGLARALPSPEYPVKIAFVRILPDLSVTPPLRQRQRSDGLAASGAPRQHQRATLQTSNRQRAIR